MRVATGRQIFFDKIAEGLQMFWASDAPKRTALSQNPSGASVPDSDIRSLASALCRLHSPSMDSIQSIRWSDNSWDRLEEPAIIDAEGRKLGEVCAKFDGLKDFPEIIVIIFFEDDGTDFPKLTYDPRSQSDIVWDGLETLFSERSINVPALARVRYESRGFQSLELDFGLFEQPETLNWEDPNTLELFYNRLSHAWNYRGGILPLSTIQAWSSQFMKEGYGKEAHQILLYLLQYGFVTEKVIATELFRIYTMLKNNSKNSSIEVSIQKPGKSEQKLAYLLRPSVLLERLDEAINSKKANYFDDDIDLYCFDDCVGSGESVIKYLFDTEHNTHWAELKDFLRSGDIHLNVVVYHADQRGINCIENHPDACGEVKVHAARVLDETHQAFSEKSRIFKDKTRREAFKNFCLNIGMQLNPLAPLGWEDGQLCIAYDYTIPDNSLPILYEQGNSRLPWKPLFERSR